MRGYERKGQLSVGQSHNREVRVAIPNHRRWKYRLWGFFRIKKIVITRNTALLARTFAAVGQRVA